MSTYVVGDLQGCLDPLKTLLDKVGFGADDTLWVAGDIINRGPQSLEALRFIKDMGNQAISVLGNHDLHLLSVAHIDRPMREGDTLDDILNADDRDALLYWLRHQKLAYYDKGLNTFMAHAGLSPHWSVDTALTIAAEIEAALQGDDFIIALELMYGNDPRAWAKCHTKAERLRYGINAFTRMRYCKRDGSLNFKYKGSPSRAPRTLRPWFKVKKRLDTTTNIVFGHWSSIGGSIYAHTFPIDTGCVWGGKLTLMCLDDFSFTQVLCQNKK